jgi:F0F1-type ATP synthase membrane subunit c/vacuolar-type H+-ATPase subunit K
MKGGAMADPEFEQSKRRRFGLLVGLAVVIYIFAVIVFLIMR